MSQQELLKRVVKVLEEAGIDYMITGSIASSFYGEPRSTQDIDVVVVIEKSKAKQLIKAFPSPDYYLTEESIFEAIEFKNMFNLLEAEHGGKVDFWILKEEPFDRSRFSRRNIEEINELKIQVSSAEDTILAKLNWAELSGGSEKQFGDSLRVYEVQYQNLDSDYLESWVKKLNLAEIWKRLKKEAEIV